MKVLASVKKICRNCKIIRRNGVCGDLHGPGTSSAKALIRLQKTTGQRHGPCERQYSQPQVHRDRAGDLRHRPARHSICGQRGIGLGEEAKTPTRRGPPR